MLKLKVCGMADRQNLEDLINIKPDFIGFIFYQKSPRNINEPEIILSVPQTINRVAVVVDKSLQEIENIIKNYNVNVIQLHGNESPDFCNQVNNLGVKTIKAFAVDNNFNFDIIKNYNTNYYLFDTKGEKVGGNGTKYNWEILKQNKIDKPYFISGGITLNDAQELKNNFSDVFAVDINSKFEIKPGFKNIAAIEKFKNNIK